MSSQVASGDEAAPERVARTFAGRLLYGAGCNVSWLLLQALGRPRLEGRKHVPRSGPLLVVANHVSAIDPPLLGAILPRRLAFLAKEELFHPAPWGWALRAAGMIPVRRGRAERHVLLAALRVLREGGALVVFPEGTRSRDGVLAAPEPGVGLLALRSQAPILPVAILGSERVRGVATVVARPRLVVRCGPVWRPESTFSGARAYREVADEVMMRIAALLPAERRGVHDGLDQSGTLTAGARLVERSP
jgi:1-acyl-sn-glycerol-3-phosphate acyltransferase